jgi:hypothetical protein
MLKLLLCVEHCGAWQEDHCELGMLPQGQDGRSEQEKGHILEGRQTYIGAVGKLGFAPRRALHCGVAKE